MSSCVRGMARLQLGLGTAPVLQYKIMCCIVHYAAIDFGFILPYGQVTMQYIISYTGVKLQGYQKNGIACIQLHAITMLPCTQYLLVPHNTEYLTTGPQFFVFFISTLCQMSQGYQCCQEVCTCIKVKWHTPTPMHGFFCFFLKMTRYSLLHKTAL